VKPVLLDTGPIVSLLDASDNFHQQCVDSIGSLRAPLVTCEAVVAESCYLLRRVKNAPQTVLQNVSSGVFQIPLSIASYANEASRILSKYQRRETDLADACLIHLAEAFQTGEILTLDRDFEFYRWSRNKPFHAIIPMS
jgi:uncharacterized protein